MTVRPLPSELRYVSGYELRSVEADGKYLECTVTTYNDWRDVGPFEERMMPGVFDGTLARHSDSVKLVLGHDDTVPGVATPVEWRNAADHLAAVYRFGSHEEARRVAQMAEERMFGGVSVGFLPGKKKGDSVWEMHDGHPRVSRYNARLLHVGLVTVAANQDADYAVRSMGVPDDLIVRTPRLEQAREILARVQASRLQVP